MTNMELKVPTVLIRLGTGILILYASVTMLASPGQSLSWLAISQELFTIAPSQVISLLGGLGLLVGTCILLGIYTRAACLTLALAAIAAIGTKTTLPAMSWVILVGTGIVWLYPSDELSLEAKESNLS